MNNWRNSLSKSQGKCKALEESLANLKKKHSKELSANLIKTTEERHKMAGDILSGLCSVSGLNEEQTIANIANERGPTCERKIVRKELIQLLDHILAEAAKKSPNNIDPKTMYAYLGEMGQLELQSIAIGMMPIYSPAPNASLPPLTKASINTRGPAQGKAAQSAASKENKNPSLKVQTVNAAKVGQVVAPQASLGLPLSAATSVKNIEDFLSKGPLQISAEWPNHFETVIGNITAALPEDISSTMHALPEILKALQASKLAGKFHNHTLSTSEFCLKGFLEGSLLTFIHFQKQRCTPS